MHPLGILLIFDPLSILVNFEIPSGHSLKTNWQKLSMVSLAETAKSVLCPDTSKILISVLSAGQFSIVLTFLDNNGVVVVGVVSAAGRMGLVSSDASVMLSLKKSRYRDTAKRHK